VYWEDLADRALWEGLSVHLTRADVARTPAWCVDVVRPGRVRVTAGDTPRWWARQEPCWTGVGLLRGAPMGPDDAVVRAITADDLRAASATPGTIAWWRHWSVWFLEAMAAGGRSPLRPGLWWVAPLACTDGPSLAVLDRPRPRDASTSRWDLARATLRRADGAPWTDDRCDERWRVNGCDALLPLRRASREDNGRVKAWRKRARDGTLPPVLVHFIGALNMFALLDGHDRFAAARLEGAPVPWLHVSALTYTPVTLDPQRQAAIVRQAERYGGAAPTATINAMYALAFDDRPWPSRPSYGRVLAGGVPRWDDEVTRRLVALGLPTAGDRLLA